jgi:hypothetical protein
MHKVYLEDSPASDVEMAIPVSNYVLILQEIHRSSGAGSFRLHEADSAARVVRRNRRALPNAERSDDRIIEPSRAVLETCKYNCAEGSAFLLHDIASENMV